MLIKRIISCLYSYWLSRRLEIKDWKNIFFSRQIFRVVVVRDKKSKILIKGHMNFRSHLGNTQPARIILEENATLIVEGDLELGAGSVILVRKNAYLKLGSPSIASNAKILVKEHMEIGHHVIIAWDVVVMDSDWHSIEGIEMTKPVKIEDHVWLSHHTSVHKGAHIHSGSIIGAHSLVLGDIPSNVLAAGIPAKSIKENVTWSR